RRTLSTSGKHMETCVARIQFRVSRTGSMALFATGTLIAAVLVIGGIVDFASLYLERKDLQTAADAAALGAVREIQIARGEASRLVAVAGGAGSTSGMNARLIQ